MVSARGARHAVRRACRDAGIACVRAESLGVDSSGSWVEGRGRVIDPRPLGAHVGRVLRLCGLLQGMVVRRTTRHGGALTRSEQNQARYRRVDAPYEVPRPTRTT